LRELVQNLCAALLNDPRAATYVETLK